ncbi:MAG: SDR family oxidoreductase [Rhodospirillaceae bacterium]|nr:SDR family oxidoreductase [Rhodospirillaceae bacterium]
MAGDLTGLGALVSGGASGIGRSCAAVLAERGARVAILDRVTAPSGMAGVIADIRRPDQVRAAVTQAEAAIGRIDILVNNAGISGRSLPLDAIDDNAFDDMFATHVKGAFVCAQAVAPGMKARRFGRIVNISSHFALIGSASASHYVGAKAALHGFTKAWALEFAPFGITVNAVAPGLVDTPMTRASVGDAELARRGAGYPVGRLPTMDEIAFAVAWLAGRETDTITGQIISPNGGIAMAGG